MFDWLFPASDTGSEPETMPAFELSPPPDLEADFSTFPIDVQTPSSEGFNYGSLFDVAGKAAILYGQYERSNDLVNSPAISSSPLPARGGAISRPSNTAPSLSIFPDWRMAIVPAGIATALLLLSHHR